MPKDIKVELGALIRELREMRGWTQKELARRIEGASDDPNMISQWELGRYHPQLDTIFRIADAFDLSASKMIEAIE